MKKAKRRPIPHFYRVIDPAGSGLEKGTIIVERKGRGPLFQQCMTDTTTMVTTVFRAEKVPHSEMPAEAVENAIKFLESN